MESICMIKDDGTSSEIIIPDFKLELSPQFPADWFKEHNQVKPPLIIEVSKGGLAEIANRLGDAWGSNTTIRDAMEFLYLYVKKHITAKLDKDWVSYGVTIGKSGDTVSPISLLAVEEKESVPDTPIGSVLDEKMYLERICMILAIYRMESASKAPGTYRDTVVSRMEEVLKGHPFNVGSIDLAPLLIRTNWARNETYRKLVAAIDMFLVHFKDHHLAPLRVTTLTSRDKDCGGMIALQDLSKIMGKSVGESLTFVLDKRVSKEVLRIIKEGDESGKDESYFHYFKELGLSQKSPFSSSMNPVLYNFTYILGALLGQTRSCHARLFSTDGIINVMNVAAYVAYYLRGWAEASMVFHKKGAAEKVSAFKEVIGDDTDEKDSFFIMKKIYENDGVITQEMRKELRESVSKLSDLRPGSIGKYVKDFFG
ncbi:putative nucleoprotein [Soybean thrips rhabdo-like virus 2]|uniref:Nucleoprotein n=1 Tax=Soybean thrips rhabdo-like virus 2 TaxID=2802236 RepID=A0A7T8G245_9RHAB|nr:putative nucleoprotein [Soybean thrips rhabdo-like virus 2]